MPRHSVKPCTPCCPYEIRQGLDALHEEDRKRRVSEVSAHHVHDSVQVDGAGLLCVHADNVAACLDKITCKILKLVSHSFRIVLVLNAFDATALELRYCRLTELGLPQIPQQSVEELREDAG